MSEKKTWDPPGWPWELDLFALLFVAIGVVVPYLTFSSGAEELMRTTANPAQLKLQEQSHLLWSIGIVVLFAMHLAVAGATIETLSTPFIHLISPLVFAVLAYYRVWAVGQDLGSQTIADGSWTQIAAIVTGVLVVTFVVARLRMARYLLRFRDVKWDIVSRAPYDSTFLELAAQFRPLVYPPRVYRACADGFLIEGWFYVMPISFSVVQSMVLANAGYSSNGKYFASSAKSLVRTELLDDTEPVFISPADRAEFVQYCSHHVLRLRPHSDRGTAAGKTRTHSTARGTHHTAAGTTHGGARATNHGTRGPSHGG